MNERQVSVGVDIGGTTTEAAVVGVDRRVLGVATVPTSRGPEGVLDSVTRATGAALQSAGRCWADAASCGVGVPGLVNPERGLVEMSVNLDLEQVHLVRLLEAAVPVPVLLDNDVNMAAIGASLVLDLPSTSLTFLNVGTGIRAAHVIDGVVLRGATNRAGELGHVGHPSGTHRCPCGQFDCPEVLHGGGAVRPYLTDASGTESTLAPSLVAQKRAELVDGLADVISLVAIAYDPQWIVAGGGVVTHASWLVPAVRARLTDRASHSPFLEAMSIHSRLVPLPAGSHAATLGAAFAGQAAKSAP